ncbi:MAG: hypothetical protein JXR88_18910 [Clostridia bacterium]|nr:hypothetical protein [Clostridia bacterium]
METYQAYLKKGLTRYFDITDEYQIGNEIFDFFAYFKQRSAKYMLLKKAEIYAYHTNEYIFHKRLNRAFAQTDLDWLKEFYANHGHKIVKRDQEHMSSTVTVIMDCVLPEGDLRKQVQKFKYYKSFAFGLKGWVNGKIILVDSSLNQGIANKVGEKDLPRFLQK